MEPRPVLYAIGHSNKSFGEFLRLLRAHDIQRVVDVRTSPTSRKNPQFDGRELARHLRARHIGYWHLKKLGGHRRPKAGSLNDGWRNRSFRGYADHMASRDFGKGVARLIASGEEKRTAMMCAEGVPWRCHRALIADWLTIIGHYEVRHIVSGRTYNRHRRTPFAKLVKGRLIYPSRQGRLFSNIGP